MKAGVSVACIQMQPEWAQWRATSRTRGNDRNRPHARGARLIVLPELCNSGLLFESRKKRFHVRAACGWRNRPKPIRTWSALAARLGVTLVAGSRNARANALYNAQR